MRSATQFFGLFRREVSRYCKVPLQTVGAPVVSAALYLLIFGVSLGESIDLVTHESYLAFLIPGLVAMSLIRNAFDNSTSTVVIKKYGNELQDLRVTPLTIQQICLAKTSASLTRGLFVSSLTLLVGEGFYLITKGTFLPIAAPGVFLFFALMSGLSFGSLGIALGMWAKSFEYIGAISALVLLPLIYLGGVFFDLSHVHLFWKFLSRCNPLFYLINGFRYGVLGIADVSISLDMAVSFLFFILCYTLATMSLKKGWRYLRF